MCGRYYVAELNMTEEMLRIVDAVNRKYTPQSVKTSGEIFPSDVVPVLANSRRQNVQPFAMRWGYSNPNGRPIINARSETASVKPLFRDGMRQRRCLIPASHYFEWEHRGSERIRYAIRPRNSGMLYLAGIYQLEKHNDAVMPAFAILTRAAAPGISFIHDRMPVILPSASITDWLDNSNDPAEVLQTAMLTMEYHSV